jgi:plastocyanin
VLLAGVAGVAGLGPVLLVTVSPAAAASTKFDVKAAGKAFSPSHRRIDPGDRVTWTNDDRDVKHSVTSDEGSTSFDADLGKYGATFEKRFDTPGTYTYHCKYHDGMVGTIDVGAPATTTTTAPVAPPTTEPPTTTTTAPATTTTAEPTTTTTEPRPAAGPVPLPPVPSSAASPPPAASSTTTSVPSTTTTSTVPPTTATSAPPAVTEEAAPPTGPAPGTPAPSADTTGDTGDEIPTAVGPTANRRAKLDAGTVALVMALVAVGAFGAWTLIRVRPGRV